MASLTLDIKSELPKAIRWTDAMTKQLPFAISQALNSTGFDIRTALGGATRQYFQQPVAFTQRAFLVRKGNKRNLQVDIYANKKQNRYLRTQVHGGSRGQKGYERRYLADAQASMPAGSRLVPSVGLKLNAAGNPSLAALRRISGQVASTGRNSVFIGRPVGGGRPPGVYQRKPNGSLTPLFVAVQRASYRPRFPMADIGTKVAQRRFGTYLRSSLERALASAK
jgi:hypothetical protein